VINLIFTLEKQAYAEIFYTTEFSEAREYVELLIEHNIDFLSFVRNKNNFSSLIEPFYKISSNVAIFFRFIALVGIVFFALDMIDMVVGGLPIYGQFYFAISIINDFLLISVFGYFYRYFGQNSESPLKPGMNTRTIKLIERMVQESMQPITEFTKPCVMVRLINSEETDSEFLNRFNKGYYILNLDEFIQFTKNVQKKKNKFQVQKQEIGGRTIEEEERSFWNISIGYVLKKADTTWDILDVFKTIETSIDFQKVSVISLAWFLSALVALFTVIIFRPTAPDDYVPFVSQWLTDINPLFYDIYLLLLIVAMIGTTIFLLVIVYFTYTIMKRIIFNAMAFYNLRLEFIDSSIFEIENLFQKLENEPDNSSIPLKIIALQNNLNQTRLLPVHYFGIYTRLLAFSPIIFAVSSFILNYLTGGF